jgi:O-antigen ligase
LGSHLADDTVTLALLGSISLLIGLPGLFLITRRITRPPFRITSFRWLYVAWACLLAASSVWNISRDVRFSVDEAGADNYVRLAFLSLGLLVILIIGARYRFAFLSELWSGALGIFLLFAVWGLASTLWSVSPAGTLIKASEYGTMLAVFALAASLINLTIKDPMNRSLALKRVFDFNWFLVLLLIASVYLGMLVWPDYAIIQGGYREGILGFYIQGALPAIAANSVGHIGAVVGVVALVRILLVPRSRALYVPIFVISLLTVVLTQSRSPILAFSLAAVAVLVASRRFVILAVSGALFGATVLLTQYGELAYNFMRRNQTDESLASLTGRVDYWQASLDAVRESPLGGYGANVGGRYVLESSLGDEVSTVHSSWVEVLLDTGVVGLILFSVGLGVTWFWLFRLRSSAMGNPISRLLWLESVSVLTVLCVRSVFAVDLVWSWHVLTFGVILVFISVMRRQVVQTDYASAPLAQSLPAARWRRSSVRY